MPGKQSNKPVQEKNKNLIKAVPGQNAKSVKVVQDQQQQKNTDRKSEDMIRSSRH